MPAAVEDLLSRLGVTGEVAAVLTHNRWLTAGAWQVRTGTGGLAVLKWTTAVRPPGGSAWDRHWTAGSGEPTRWNYWCREALAYGDGTVEAYGSPGLAAPACLGIDVTDGDAVLLLEWVDGASGPSWPVATYGPAAEALGRAQASFLTGDRDLPPWSSRRFLREYGSEKPVDWSLLDDDGAWAHPAVRAWFPGGLREDVEFLHAHRERLYRVNEQLPRTLCHLDVWPNNLVRRPDGRTALLDWAFAGWGAIGEDAGNLVPDSSFDHFVPAADLPRLEQVVFDGYLQGLRARGWDDDPRLVQLGMWSSAVKYDWMAPLTLEQVGHRRQYAYGGVGEVDAAMKFRERSRVLRFLAGWARQAVDLAEQVGL